MGPGDLQRMFCDVFASKFRGNMKSTLTSKHIELYAAILCEDVICQPQQSQTHTHFGVSFAIFGWKVKGCNCGVCNASALQKSYTANASCSVFARVWWWF